MRFLKSFLKSKSDKNKINYINNIIDSELQTSMKFELKLDEKTIEKQKDLFINLFQKYWNDIENSNDANYYKLKNFISNEIFESLQEELKKDFENSTGVKNKYQCHLSTLINRLFIEINNKIPNI